MLTFDDYSNAAKRTALIPPREPESFYYGALGLAGEAGEIANKIKKVIRDNDGMFDSRLHGEVIAQELGDVLWYLWYMAEVCGFTLDQVAAMNIQKLQDRKDRGVISGSGDNR